MDNEKLQKIKRLEEKYKKIENKINTTIRIERNKNPSKMYDVEVNGITKNYKIFDYKCRIALINFISLVLFILIPFKNSSCFLWCVIEVFFAKFYHSYIRQGKHKFHKTVIFIFSAIIVGILLSSLCTEYYVHLVNTTNNQYILPKTFNWELLFEKLSLI